ARREIAEPEAALARDRERRLVGGVAATRRSLAFAVRARLRAELARRAALAVELDRDRRVGREMPRQHAALDRRAAAREPDHAEVDGVTDFDVERRELGRLETVGADARRPVSGRESRREFARAVELREARLVQEAYVHLLDRQAALRVD